MARVLVIDDSQTMLRLVGAWLQEAGHEVIALESGRRVSRLLRVERVDLVLTDIHMPDIDGLELLRLVRTACPHLPCIAMSSAEGRLDFLPVARALGASATLRKPFQPPQLLAAVSAALGSATPPASRPVTAASPHHP